MNDDHWFDTLNKRLSQSAPRRGFLSAVTALSIAQQLGASDVIAKGGGKGGKHKGQGKGGGGNRGNKGKGKGKGKGKNDEKPDPWGCTGRLEDLNIKDPKCSGGTCDAHYPGDPCEEKYCEFICNQCDGDDSRDFCIVRRLPSDDKVANCCAEVSPKCCGRQCCKANANCCNGSCCGDSSSPEFKCCNGTCIDTSQAGQNCGSCGNQCPAGQFCEEGRCICRGGPCDPACPAGLTYCNGECVDTMADPRHCGGCNAQNVNGLKCCDGNLCHYIDGVCCGATCYPSGWPSCG